MQGPRIRSLSEWTRSENDPQGSGAREDRANGLSQTVKVVGLADNVTRHDLEMALAAGHDRAGNVIESVHWLASVRRTSSLLVCVCVCVCVCSRAPLFNAQDA